MAGGNPALPPYLIVDGHSMIFAWDDLRELHQRGTAAARDELRHRLTTYQDVTGEHVVLVFDGKGEDAQALHEPDGIQVFYSGGNATADQIIEKLAGKYASNRRITVASRDRAVLDTCSAFGADAISATGLLELVETAERRLRDRLAGVS